jgi:hypothetical protein
MIKGNQFFLLFLGLIILNSGISQVNSQKPDITRIYEDAERLYRAGNYNASLELLKKESRDWLVNSDTLMYIKIKNLEYLYRSDLNYTKDLESTLQRFLARVNKNSFPEFKYSEVTSIYTNFQSFKEKDKAFYDSVSRTLDMNKTTSLVPIKQVTNDYLKAYPNSYYSAELNGYVQNINDKLAQLEIEGKKRVKDSTNRAALKQVGKMLVLNLTYSVPNGGTTVFAGLHSYNEVVNFFNGNYTGPLGEKYSVGASLAEAFINVVVSTKTKFGINWNLFDAEYAVFDWSGNSYISEKQTAGEPIKELKSIKAGTRIGPVISFLVSKSIAVSVYYSARPGVQFLMGKTYFDVTNGTVIKTYEVKPVQTNFNMSNEIGIKFHFFRRLFVSPYFNFGNWNWKNEISEIAAGVPTNTIETQADYKFKFIGLRLGF